MTSILAGKGRRHQLDRMTDAVLEDGNPTNHGSLSQDDKNENQALQFPDPTALQPQEDPYQELFALIVQLGSETSIQFCDQFMRTLENNKLVLLHFVKRFNSYDMILKIWEKQLTTGLNGQRLERNEIISSTSSLKYHL